MDYNEEYFCSIVDRYNQLLEEYDYIKSQYVNYVYDSYEFIVCLKSLSNTIYVDIYKAIVRLLEAEVRDEYKELLNHVYEILKNIQSLIEEIEKQCSPEPEL